MRFTVRTVQLPMESAIADWYNGADLADAFSITLPLGAPHDIDRLARAALGDPAPWFRALLALRDVLVAPFGVKSSAQVRREVRARSDEYIDFFPILSRTAKEIVVGENDRHLDFKTSLLIRMFTEGQQELVVTSIAHCNNRFGRVYLVLIAPFHRLVVRSGLKRAAAKGWQVP